MPKRLRVDQTRVLRDRALYDRVRSGKTPTKKLVLSDLHRRIDEAAINKNSFVIISTWGMDDQHLKVFRSSLPILQSEGYSVIELRAEPNEVGTNVDEVRIGWN